MRATPVFANAIPGLPFGLDGMIGPSLGGGQRALTEDRFVELPPATPVNAEGAAHHEWLQSPNLPALEAATNGRHEAGSIDDASVVEGVLVTDGTGVSVSFTSERLTRTLRFLEEARFPGLITHLFAIRAFFPETIGDSHAGSVTAMREMLREEFDRLFIKLRLPNYVIAARDIETPSLRATVERFVHDASTTRGIPADVPGAAVVLRGTLDAAGFGEIADALSEAELASALPWTLLARALPDGTPQLAHYRKMLVDRLDELVDAEAAEFLDSLQRRRDTALDAALDVVRTALYANAR